MFESVRTRLTIWYTAILALVLITFSAISYVLLARATRSATDLSLADTSQELRRSFAIRGADGVQDFKYKDREVLIFAANGRILAASPPRLAPKERARIVALIRSGASGFHTVEGGEEGDGVRVVAVPAAVRGGRYVAVVAQDLDVQADRLENALHAVLLGIPLALIVAAGGGYLIARKSLAPLAAMSEGLERAFASQRRFMADASHELRTPVSIIQGEADVALGREDRSAVDYRETIEIIRKSSRKLMRIVENLFLLARSDAGTYPIDRSRFYLDEVIADSVRAMRTVASAKEIDLKCNTPADLMMSGDEELLQRMLLNLLDNAVKFTASGGHVLVTADREDHTYTIRVVDSAEPVTAEDRAKIFERFYRADRSRGGAGLGLPIARWIAEMHGGSLELEERPAAGNSFRVTLPATA